MKKTDIAMIILIAAASVTIAFFVTKSIMGGTATEEVKVDTMRSVDADVKQPSDRIFNSNAINPSVEVQIVPKSQ